MSERFLLHGNSRLDTSLCITDIITNYGQTVLLHSFYRPDLAPSDYHLFDPLKKLCTTEHCVLAAAEKGRKLLPGVSTSSCSKTEEVLTKTENTLKITMPSVRA